jgi:formylglycine-generating enzyme required for sulfatase activity
MTNEATPDLHKAVSRARSFAGLTLLALAVAGLACSFGSRPVPTPAPDQLDLTPAGTLTPPIAATLATLPEEAANAVQAATYALAVHLGRDPVTLVVTSVTPTVFADDTMGCPRAGETAAAQEVPGYMVIVTDGMRHYELHTSLDGLRVRCLSQEMGADQPDSSRGIMATVRALENQEYGTLASLLPGTVNIGTFPQAPQPIASSAFITQLRDIWLGPGRLQVDLNTNVLGLMPNLELPPGQIPVFSTGWSAARDTDGILFFDVAAPEPVLRSVWLIPAAQKPIAYRPAATEGVSDTSIFHGQGYSLLLPAGWISFTLGNSVNLQPPGEETVVTAGPWLPGSAPVPASLPAEGQSFRSWVETRLRETTPNLENVNITKAIWAASGQAGYLLTWSQRRTDGVLESSQPMAVLEADQPAYHALALQLLDPAFDAEFGQIVASTVISQAVGVPADMQVYRHDGLGYRLQFPVGWTLLPSTTGAGFELPDGPLAVSVAPWPVSEGPAAGQSFDQWVAAAPAGRFPGFGDLQQIQPVTAAGDVRGYLAVWQVQLSDGRTVLSDPVALFPFSPPPDAADPTTLLGSYHALAISLHVPTQTVVFDRMIGTLVIERRDTDDMVYIPAGPFVRGSNEEQTAAYFRDCGGGCRADEFTDESPQRLVTLKSYYIDRTEVTLSQFRTFVDATGYRTTSQLKGDAIQYTWRAFDAADRQDHPVRWLSWEDANAYCLWAGKRLPTEAEWEKAARGTDGRIWPWGSNQDDGRVPHGDTVPVESYLEGASPYGVLGMAGNVWEWVSDWYQPTYYGVAPEADPAGPVQGVDRVLRGGGYNNLWWALRAAHRHSGGVQGYAADHGVRCARDG